MAEGRDQSPYTQHVPCLLKSPGTDKEKRSRLTLSFGTTPAKPTPKLPLPVPNTVFKETYFVAKSMNQEGQLKFDSDRTYNFSAGDLTDLGEIGSGNFGTVNRMFHPPSSTMMAVKRIRSTVDEKEQKQLLMDLEVVMKSSACLFIVQFYGAIFYEGDCWICMELMDTSLDTFYKYIYHRLGERIPEPVLGRITVATLNALSYLKEQLQIIHRDVKPSNILLDKRGNIKLCDFGISGQLIDSIAKTRDAGCRPYMAPERIDPSKARCYDIRSDVWSLGITLFELATGSFPYPKWNSVFEQLTQVVQGEPPRLTRWGPRPIPPGSSPEPAAPNAADPSPSSEPIFSEEMVDFVNTCLQKDESCRPKYKGLLRHVFVRRYDNQQQQQQKQRGQVDVCVSACDSGDTLSRVAEYFSHHLLNMANRQ